VPVIQEFFIYNQKNKYNVALVSDTFGTVFRPNNNPSKKISYQIDGKDASSAKYDFE
jgi:hypothetical protein